MVLQCNHTVNKHVSPSPKNITLFNAFLRQVLYRSHGPGSLHLQIYARNLSALKHLHQDGNGKMHGENAVTGHYHYTTWELQPL